MDELTPNIVGDFENPYQQQYSDTCAIKSQQLILQDFGIDVSEDQLVEYSIQHGWYNGDGTQMGDIGKCLVDAGIPCHQQVDANVYDLVNELQMGHKVIVGVDSGELWDNSFWDWLKDLFVGDTPDHALIVAGIDMSDPDNPMVILTDPGTGEPSAPYPLDQFMDAWKDSQCFMVATDVSTGDSMNSFVDNGLTEMHLDTIAGVDYDVFEQFLDYSHQIDYPTYGADLYGLFDNFNSYNMPFNDLMVDNNMPLYNPDFIDINGPFAIEKTGFVDPNSDLFQPLVDTSWLNCPNYGFDTSNEISAHSMEVLQDCLTTAQEHYQDCMDNGDYIMAQIWQNQATAIENDLSNMVN